MRRLIQHFLGVGLVAVLLGAGFLPARGEPAEAPGKDDRKPYTETIPGTKVSFDMVPIPGGTFVMGSPESEKDRNKDNDEGPQHPVTLRPFYMGKCEVSWDEYDLYRKEMGVENPEVNDKVLAKTPDAITGPTPTYVDETYDQPSETHTAL